MVKFATTRSYFHRGGDTPLIGTTIDAFLKGVMARHADREAVVSIPQGVRLTYGALDRRVEELAAGLLALGVEAGGRVGVWSTNNVQWVLLQLAAARVGALLVNINPAYRTDELRHALELAGVQVLFVIPSFKSSDYIAMVREVCPETGDVDPDRFACRTRSGLPDLRRIVAFDPEHAEGAAPVEGAFLSWPDVLQMGRSISAEAVADRAAEVDVDDPFNIQFTSGTTGAPKAVLLTHHNVLNNGFFVGEAMGFAPEDRLCVPVPFYHCFGMVVANLACLTHGAAIVIPAPAFDPSATLHAIQAEQCTAVDGVPTMFIALLEEPDLGSYDLSSLRTGLVAGAPCPAELMRRVMDDLGCRQMRIAYGQTESSPVTHMTRLGDTPERRAETVGTNLPHQEVKIIDPESGRTLPIGRPGEVCFRGYHVMRGYYAQPQATREAIDDTGWLHSGDLGVMDGDGYLRITGRLKDMIIRGGENIYPAEIEAFYFRHPKVAAAAVFGVPDPRLGEAVAAWIKLHEGQTAEPQELAEYARGRIAHFKVPKHIWIVQDFPMTATGKVQKFRMRQISAEWLKQNTLRPTA